MRRMLLVSLVAGMVVSLPGSAARAATPPPTLTGETFTISPPTVTAHCDPTGTSTVSYTVSGVAVGPYPGTYSETGTLTIGPQTLPQFVNGFEFGPITSANVSFSIDSPTGQVTGTKSLPSPSIDAFGLCYAPAPGGGSFVELCACNLSLSYTATIDTPDGQFGDTGTAGLILDQVQGTVISPIPGVGALTPVNEFMESFASSLLVPFLICDQNSQVNQMQGNNNQGCTNP